MSHVKPGSRQAKAAETRSRMLEAAHGAFAELGYRATTMQEIATRADVAVQTLYFTFHTKDELLQAVQDRAVLGEDGLPPHLQPWFQEMRDAASVAAAIDAFCDGISAICARVAPLIPTFHAVASDPAGAVWRESERLRREGFRDVVHLWKAKCPLREGVTTAIAVDLLMVLAGPEVYRSLTAECGWSARRHREWLARALRRDLFDLG